MTGMPPWPPQVGDERRDGDANADAQPPDRVTLLQCADDQIATKHVRLDAGNVVVTRSSDKITYWAWTQAEVDGIHLLSELLSQAAQDPRVCVIRGDPLPGIPSAGVRRLSNYDVGTGEAPTFASASRRWVAFDFDQVGLSEDVDLVADPEQAMRVLIRERLPPAFHGVTCHWTLSSSAAAGRTRTINARPWFWLDRAVSDSEWKAWADANGIPPSVKALFQAVQIHYVAAPRVEGADWIPRRFGLLVGERDRVTLPPTPYVEVEHPVDDGPRPEETPELVAQATAHLATLPPHKPGNNMMWHAALTLARGFALSEETTFQLLRDNYDPRCEPPWDDEAKLRHKAEDAFRATKVPLGYLTLCSCRACDSVTGGVRPVTLDMLRKHAKQLSKSKTAPKSELGDLLEKVVAGEPFGEGDARRRDDAVERLTFDLARHFRGYSGQSIAKLFEPSLKKMKETDSSSPGPTVVLEQLNHARKKQQVVGDLICSENGRPENLLANVLHVLATHPAWRDVLAFCELRQTVVKLAPPPVRVTDGAGELGEWTEEDTHRACAWFAQVAKFEPNAQKMIDAVETTAKKKIVHPVREYLTGLIWDRTPRLDSMLPCYFRTDDTQFTRAVGPKFMIGAVARAYRPGVKVDTMPVMESAQGLKKSTGLAALVPNPDWYSDTPIPLDDKDRFQMLRGIWLYELSELDSFRGKDGTRIKAFVSSKADNYRPSYGRRNRMHPRTCVFAGTTNEHAYLIDRTGNRRFWPVKCHGVIDVAGIERDRDQLWAEAVHRYLAGETWWIDSAGLQRVAEGEQEAREIGDDWTEVFAGWLLCASKPNPNYASDEWTKKDKADPEKINERIPLDLMVDGVSTYDVLTGAVRMPLDRIEPRHTMRAGVALRKLGLEPRQRTIRETGTREHRYFPSPLAPPVGHLQRWSKLSHLQKADTAMVLQALHVAGGRLPEAELRTAIGWAKPRMDVALDMAIRTGAPGTAETWGWLVIEDDHPDVLVLRTTPWRKP